MTTPMTETQVVAVAMTATLEARQRLLPLLPPGVYHDKDHARQFYKITEALQVLPTGYSLQDLTKQSGVDASLLLSIEAESPGLVPLSVAMQDLLATRISGCQKSGSDKMPFIQAAAAIAAEAELMVAGNDTDTEPDKWPVLSSDALPGWIGDFVTLATDHSEADPVAVLATLLCRFAVECGSSPHVYVGDSKHRSRTNFVLVGASSKSRKGTSAKPVERLFAEIPTGCRTSPGPLSSGEGLIYAVRDATTKFDEKSGADIVTDPGVTDKRLFVLDEEMASALNCTKREGNTLSAIVRGFYDDGHADPLTKTSKIRATGAHVGILTHITQRELTTLLNDVQMTNGFANRFLWLAVRRQKLIALPAPMPDNLVCQFREIVVSALHTAHSVTAVRMSSEATALWIDSYHQLSMDHDGVAGSVVNRQEAHAVRLALIYSLALGHEQIEVQDLKSALAFTDYARKSAFLIFGSVPDDKRKGRILDALTGADGHQMTLTDISNRVFSRNVKADVLQKLLAEMESSKLVCIEKPHAGEGKSGAPKTMIKLSTLNEKNELNEITPLPRDINSLNSLNSYSSTENAGVINSLNSFNSLDNEDEIPDFDF